MLMLMFLLIKMLMLMFNDGCDRSRVVNDECDEGGTGGTVENVETFDGSTASNGVGSTNENKNEGNDEARVESDNIMVEAKDKEVNY